MKERKDLIDDALAAIRARSKRESFRWRCRIDAMPAAIESWLPGDEQYGVTLVKKRSGYAAQNDRRKRSLDEPSSRIM